MVVPGGRTAKWAKLITLDATAALDCQPTGGHSLGSVRRQPLVRAGGALGCFRRRDRLLEVLEVLEEEPNRRRWTLEVLLHRVDSTFCSTCPIDLSNFSTMTSICCLVVINGGATRM